MNIAGKTIIPKKIKDNVQMQPESSPIPAKTDYEHFSNCLVAWSLLTVLNFVISPPILFIF